MKSQASDPQLCAAVGVALRRRRELLGMTQADLARRAGISQSAISNYEAGRRDVPLTMALVLCNRLRLSVARLVAQAKMEARP